MNLLHLLGLRERTFPLSPDATLTCACDTYCTGGYCHRRYQAARDAITEDRDGWLDLGYRLAPVLLVGPDGRGLPIYRVRAGRR